MLRRVMMSRWVSNAPPTFSVVTHDTTRRASWQDTSAGNVDRFIVGFIFNGISAARTKGFSKFFTTGPMKHVTTV